MKVKKSFALLLTLVLAAGCKQAKNAATQASTNSLDSLLPAQAQPTLRQMKIYLGAETLDAELATTPREEETGMMFRTNVTDQSAMLFVLNPFPQQADFWMKNCPHSLSAAYISPDGLIQEIHHLEKNDTNGVLSATANIGYVLEVNDGWFQRYGVNTGMLVRTEAGSLQQTFFRNQ